MFVEAGSLWLSWNLCVKQMQLFSQVNALVTRSVVAVL